MTCRAPHGPAPHSCRIAAPPAGSVAPRRDQSNRSPAEADFKIALTTLNGHVACGWRISVDDGFLVNMHTFRAFDVPGPWLREGPERALADALIAASPAPPSRLPPHYALNQRLAPAVTSWIAFVLLRRTAALVHLTRFLSNGSGLPCNSSGESARGGCRRPKRTTVMATACGWAAGPDAAKCLYSGQCPLRLSQRGLVLRTRAGPDAAGRKLPPDSLRLSRFARPQGRAVSDGARLPRRTPNRHSAHTAPTRMRRRAARRCLRFASRVTALRLTSTRRTWYTSVTVGQRSRAGWRL